MSLNPEQLQVVNANDNKILCLAGAGAGKTFTMLERIYRLIHEGADPNNILVLTFTNAAAFEMRNRFITKCSTRSYPEFRTFHSLCYSLISKDKDILHAIGYNKTTPQIIDENQLKLISTKIRSALGITLSSKQLKEPSKLSKRDAEQYELYNKRLKQELNKSGYITFDQLQHSVCKLFIENAECVIKYKLKYKYIFVDEFQDTDQTQYDFISSFADSSLFVVGDILQCIYQFRGCTNDIIKSLTRSKDWTMYKLHHNYRSTEEICKFANTVSMYASDYRIELKSDRSGDSVDVDVGSASTYSRPVDDFHMRDVITRIKSDKGSSAILCRTNRECDYVISKLLDKGISVSCNKNNDALDLLKSSLDNEYLINWIASNFNSAKFSDYIRLSTIHASDNKLNWFLQEYGDDEEVAVQLNKICKIRQVLKSDNLSIQKCSDIFKILAIHNDKPFDSVVNKPSNIVNYLTEVLESNINEIYVGTIHSSKGLEYDNVYLMGVDDTNFRLNSESNLNLYYVGITRAKNTLHVYRR